MSASVSYLTPITGCTIAVPPPKPVWLPPIWPGELDGRYINCTPDLGPFGDKFLSVDTLALTVVRQDNQPTTSADLQLASANWPTTLDPTKLIATFGFYAPLGSADISYFLIFTATPTTLGRIYVRYLAIQVVPWPGSQPRVAPPTLTLLYNAGGVLITNDPLWPLDPSGLPPGALWSNAGSATGPGAQGVVTVVPGITPDPTAPAVYFGQITSSELLALGGGNLPLTPGPTGSKQLWNNNSFVGIS